MDVELQEQSVPLKNAEQGAGTEGAETAAGAEGQQNPAEGTQPEQKPKEKKGWFAKKVGKLNWSKMN